jgi:hypothetical protein
VTDSLCVLNMGHPLTQPVDSFVVSDANAIWVDHTAGHESLKGVHERVLAAAASAGFEPVMLKTYYDRNGRPMFQSYRFKNRTTE